MPAKRKIKRSKPSQKELLPGFDNILMLAFAIAGLAAIFIIIFLTLRAS